jgi:hypothetical protein
MYTHFLHHIHPPPPCGGQDLFCLPVL